MESGRETCGADEGLVALVEAGDSVADVRFMVGAEREEVYAVKAVLATHSGTFRAMFAPDRFREGLSSSKGGDGLSEVVLPDVDPRPFRLMIDFVHGGGPAPSSSEFNVGREVSLGHLIEHVYLELLRYPRHTTATIKKWVAAHKRPKLDTLRETLQLLAVANRFLVDDLNILLLSHLQQELTPSNVLTILDATLDLAPCFANHIKLFIEEPNMSAQVLHKADLSTLSPDAVAFVLRCNLWMTEIVIFRFLQRWFLSFSRRQRELAGDHVISESSPSTEDGEGSSNDEPTPPFDRASSYGHEEEVLDELLKLIDFRLITASDLAGVVEPSGLLTDRQLVAAYRFASTHQMDVFPNLGHHFKHRLQDHIQSARSAARFQHAREFEWSVQVIKTHPDLISINILFERSLQPQRLFEGSVVVRGMEVLLFRDRFLFSHLVLKSQRAIGIGDSIQLGKRIKWCSDDADLTVLVHFPTSARLV